LILDLIIQQKDINFIVQCYIINCGVSSNFCVCLQPAVSIGNVGQLTADLLVSSMGSEKVGYLDDPYVLPCVGNDAYGPFPQGDLALPIEGAALIFCFLICFVSNDLFEFGNNFLLFLLFICSL
jgi:hypothetical protein